MPWGVGGDQEGGLCATPLQQSDDIRMSCISKRKKESSLGHMIITCSSHDSPNVEPIELQEVISRPKPRPCSSPARVNTSDEDRSVAAEGEPKPTSAAIHSHQPERRKTIFTFQTRGKPGLVRASFPDHTTWE